MIENEYLLNIFECSLNDSRTADQSRIRLRISYLKFQTDFFFFFLLCTPLSPQK